MANLKWPAHNPTEHLSDELECQFEPGLYIHHPCLTSQMASEKSVMVRHLQTFGHVVYLQFFCTTDFCCIPLVGSLKED